MDIHNYDIKYSSTRKRIEEASLSTRNKELILNFVDDLILENISKPRLIKYMECLKMIIKVLGKDLDEVTIDELKRYVGNIQQSNYSPWTKRSYKVIIRRFYKWFHKTPDKAYPPIVSWIKISMSRSERKLPSDGELITEDDVKKLIAAASHPRDKALVAILWESGARIGEIGNLRLKHVSFDKYGMVITVLGKTGSRKIRLISSTPYLSTYLSVHPQRDDVNAPMWLNIGTMNHHQQMQYKTLRMTFARLFVKAGIKKRANPHLFRHSRATFLANHLTEFQMNQYFGWIQGSGMPSTYVHMSGKEVDSAILLLNGMKNEGRKEGSKLIPRVCSRCDTINSHDSRFCLKCGGIMDLKYAMELQEQVEQRKDADNIMAMLLKDKDIQQLLMEKLKSYGTQL